MAGPFPGAPYPAPGSPSSGGVADLMREISCEPGRHIAIPGTLNFRDAGGYPVVGGGVTGWRRLLRSDGLHRLSQGATDRLGGLGLRTVLDLRTGAEAQIAPSPVDDFARNGALTMNISLIGDDLGEMPGDLAAIYDYVVDRRGAAIAAAIRSLARPGALPGLVHCTAGQDRAGVVVAFAHASGGGAHPVVAADYPLSSLSLDPQPPPTNGRVQQ